MNEDTVTDLKQFITATVSQQTSDLKQESTQVKQSLSKVDQKIDDLSASVAEAIDNANEHNEARFKNHEKRITRLEHKSA